MSTEPPLNDPAEPDEPLPDPSERPVIPEPDDDDFDPIRFEVGQGGPVLGVRLNGPNVGTGEIDIDVAGDFLLHLEKLVHGIAARLSGFSIPRRGAIPWPEGVAPLRLSADVGAGSVNFAFRLGPGEALSLTDPGSPTVEAVQRLVDLLAVDHDVEPSVEQLKFFGDRISNDFVGLLEFLALEEVDSVWRTVERPPVAIPSVDAHWATMALRSDAPPVVGDVQFIGDLFRVDSHQFGFNLQTRDDQSIRGTYSAALVEQVRSAWAKNVVVELRQTEFRWIYSDEPREVRYELVRIIEILGPAGAPSDEVE